jgi:hypothetical protein
MRTTFLFGVALLVACGGAFAQGKYPGGIVYGPKAAFTIRAPGGWVLDNESGANQGQPCVLDPKGESWSDARTVMYAKIAGIKFEDVNAFVALAIKEMEKTHGKPKEKIASGKTADGREYFINEIRRQRTTLNGNGLPTFNCQRQSLTSYSQREMKRAIAKIFQRSTKCLNRSPT